MFPSQNLINSPIPVFWNRINGSICIFYVYPHDSLNVTSKNLDSIISLPLELYNPHNSFDSSFEYLIHNNYLTSLPQKLANVWKMIGWCYNKTHIIDSTLMRNYSSIFEFKKNLLQKTNKEKGNFFINSYQELLIDSPNNNSKHILTLLPFDIVDKIIKKINDPTFLPDVENEYIPNTYSSNFRFPNRIKPLIHSGPQTIAFGSLTPNLQETLQNLQETLINQTNPTNTPNTADISTTAEPSETETETNINEPESSPLEPTYSSHA